MQKPQYRRNKSGTPHYQTFPTKPPSGRGLPPPDSPSPSSPGSGITRSSGRLSTNSRNNGEPDGIDGNEDQEEGKSPAPFQQLAVLAIISLAEQTALNSISPYLPRMAASFPGVERERVGLYVGIIASSYALAQVLTNFYWGRLSDRIGRKPVILLGTFLTAACFAAFGYCKTLWQAITVQALIGAVNGNQGVVSTVLGEITNASNQSSAFAWLPMVYGIGSILGPVLGGLLSGGSADGRYPLFRDFPYLLPNLVAAGILLLDLALTMYMLEESLQQAQDLPPLHERFKNTFSRFWQFTAGVFKPTSQEELAGPIHRHHSSSTRSPSPEPLFPASSKDIFLEKIVFTAPIMLLLCSFLVFNLSNITFMSLYPIFVSDPPPIGRGFEPKAIGLTLSVAGVAAIMFQMVVFTKIQHRMGNKIGYVISLLLMAISFFLMPLTTTPPIDTSDTPSASKIMTSVYTQTTLILVLRSIASVMGLTCAMIMITNSSPYKATLGQINGIAQTLSAGGRAIGPFLSGGLWSVAVKMAKSKGGATKRPELLPWGVFGGLTLVGTVLAIFIKSKRLEGEGGVNGSEAGKDDEEDDGVLDEEEAAGGRTSSSRSPSGERTGLLTGQDS